MKGIRTLAAASLHRALLDLGDVGARSAQRRRGEKHRSGPALLAPPPARPRARTPLSPRADLTVHWGEREGEGGWEREGTVYLGDMRETV